MDELEKGRNRLTATVGCSTRAEWRTGLVWVIAVQMVLGSAFGQAPPTAAPEQPYLEVIQIRVVSGEGAANNLGRDSNGIPAVKILDGSEAPIMGATVVFTLPADGPSGEFKDGSRTLIATTDAKGVAQAHSLRVNMMPGRLAIHVNASYRGLRASTNITQFNLAVPGVRAASKGGKKIAVWLAAAAGGAAAAGMVASRKSNSGPGGAAAASPISIGTGSASVGPPR